MAKTLAKCMEEMVNGKEFRHPADSYGPSYNYILRDVQWISHANCFFINMEYLNGTSSGKIPIIMHADDILVD